MLPLQSISMSQPGYMGRSPVGSQPPSVRVGMKVTCSQPDAAASTSVFRAKFLGFLGQQPVMDLVRELTATSEGGAWTARDDNPPFNFGAVLAAPYSGYIGEIGEEHEAPAAWARILLPDSRIEPYGFDARCAYLVLHADLARADSLASWGTATQQVKRILFGTPPPAASLAIWYQRFSEALKLPSALAAFLADDLGLASAGDPPAQVGVWLKAPHSMTELVKVDAFEVVGGSAESASFTGFAIAGPDGEDMSAAALSWLRHMCDSSLHLDGYEFALASLGQES